jgi:ABC-type lipoprotein export system ATPase subunit
VIIVTHDSRVYCYGERIVHMSDEAIERVEENVGNLEEAVAATG